MDISHFFFGAGGVGATVLAYVARGPVLKFIGGISGERARLERAKLEAEAEIEKAKIAKQKAIEVAQIEAHAEEHVAEITGSHSVAKAWQALGEALESRLSKCESERNEFQKQYNELKSEHSNCEKRAAENERSIVALREELTDLRRATLG